MKDPKTLHQAMLNAESEGRLDEARHLARIMLWVYPDSPEVEDARRIYPATNPTEAAQESEQRQRNKQPMRLFALVAGLFMTLESLVLLYFAHWWQPRVAVAVYSLPGVALILVSIRSFIDKSRFPAWAGKLAWAAFLVSLLVLGLVPFVYYAMLVSAFMS